MGITASNFSFSLNKGRVISNKYEVIQLLGCGWEGEVYKVRELFTGIERAAKLFYPHRNPNDKTARYHAEKLHKLKDCSILIHYHTQEKIIFKKIPTTVLISEYIEGPLLSDYVNSLYGKRLMPHEALRFLYALAKGVESIHQANEYHGDLHTDNIIICKHGINIDLKFVDLFNINQSKRDNKKEDLLSIIHVFHEVLGGARHYVKHPDIIKKICCGLKASLIFKKFKTVSQLCSHIETINWI